MDQKENLMEQDLTLTVVLPGGAEKTTSVHGSKPMMDLLVMLCAKYHLNPSSYTLELVSPNRNHIKFKPNTLIGALEAERVLLKPKGADDKNKKTVPQMPEATVRLIINYKKTQKTILRVSPRVPLEELLPAVCEKCEFEQMSTVLLRDLQSEEPLDLRKSLNDFGLREVYARETRGTGVGLADLSPSLVLPDHNSLLGKDKTTNEKENKGLFGVFRRSKKKHEKAATASAPASPTQNKQRPDSTAGLSLHATGYSSNTMPSDGPKKRRAPLPPMMGSQSCPSSLAKHRVEVQQDGHHEVDQVLCSLSQGAPSESSLKRTKRRAPPPPCALPPDQTGQDDGKKDQTVLRPQSILEEINEQEEMVWPKGPNRSSVNDRQLDDACNNLSADVSMDCGKPALTSAAVDTEMKSPLPLESAGEYVSRGLSSDGKPALDPVKYKVDTEQILNIEETGLLQTGHKDINVSPSEQQLGPPGGNYLLLDKKECTTETSGTSCLIPRPLTREAGVQASDHLASQALSGVQLVEVGAPADGCTASCTGSQAAVLEATSSTDSPVEPAGLKREMATSTEGLVESPPTLLQASNMALQGPPAAESLPIYIKPSNGLTRDDEPKPKSPNELTRDDNRPHEFIRNDVPKPKLSSELTREDVPMPKLKSSNELTREDVPMPKLKPSNELTKEDVPLPKPKPSNELTREDVPMSKLKPSNELTTEDVPMPKPKPSNKLTREDVPMPKLKPSNELTREDVPMPKLKPSNELTREDVPMPKLKPSNELTREDVPMPKLKPSNKLTREDVPMPKLKPSIELTREDVHMPRPKPSNELKRANTLQPKRSNELTREYTHKPKPSNELTRDYTPKVGLTTYTVVPQRSQERRRFFEVELTLVAPSANMQQEESAGVPVPADDHSYLSKPQVTEYNPESLGSTPKLKSQLNNGVVTSGNGHHGNVALALSAPESPKSLSSPEGDGSNCMLLSPSCGRMQAGLVVVVKEKKIPPVTKPKPGSYRLPQHNHTPGDYVSSAAVRNVSPSPGGSQSEACRRPGQEPGSLPERWEEKAEEGHRGEVTPQHDPAPKLARQWSLPAKEPPSGLTWPKLRSLAAPRPFTPSRFAQAVSSAAKRSYSFTRDSSSHAPPPPHPSPFSPLTGDNAVRGLKDPSDVNSNREIEPHEHGNGPEKATGVTVTHGGEVHSNLGEAVQCGDGAAHPLTVGADHTSTSPLLALRTEPTQV